MTTQKKVETDGEAISQIANEIEALNQMSTKQLHDKHREVFGEDTNSRNTVFLRRKIAYRLQERAEGGLSERAKEKIEELAETTPVRRRPGTTKGSGARTKTKEEKASVEKKPAPEKPSSDAEKEERDPRLPEPGTILTRVHEGKVHKVKVLEDGCQYDGKRYRSLSAVAKEITGTVWNGLLFFNLTSRKKSGPADGGNAA